MKNGLRANWKVRRRIIIATLLFCAIVIFYCVHKGGDSRVLETAVSSAFLLAGMVIGSYVFGAVWQDVSKNGKEVSE
jgi:DMSO reductase anchor subunit